jgi:hypothetical protein
MGFWIPKIKSPKLQAEKIFFCKTPDFGENVLQSCLRFIIRVKLDNRYPLWVISSAGVGKMSCILNINDV